MGRRDRGEVHSDRAVPARDQRATHQIERGQWQPRLSYDSAVHDVRFDDKVHVTEDGSQRTSRWTVATLAQLWSRPQLESVI